MKLPSRVLLLSGGPPAFGDHAAKLSSPVLRKWQSRTTQPDEPLQRFTPSARVFRMRQASRVSPTTVVLPPQDPAHAVLCVADVVAVARFTKNRQIGHVSRFPLKPNLARRPDEPGAPQAGSLKGHGS